MIAQLAALGKRRSKIPFDMFALEQEARTARTGARLRNIYHRGQDLMWDGQSVLRELVTKHGGIKLPGDKRDALSRIFEVILWGELAAWKISAELADVLSPLEAKMAATSQAHDEARHFYVMYDYLSELGYAPRGIDPYSQRLLDITLNTQNLAHKLLGMQLMIETIAITLFGEVRRLRVEPVLADLLRYYEKDEARHIGLGTQYLPELIERMSAPELAALTAFQLRLVFWSILSLKGLEPDLATLGIPARDMIARGMAKQRRAFDEMWSRNSRQMPLVRELIERGIEGIEELVFPTPETAHNLRARVRAAHHRFRTARRITVITPKD
jgi:hypothetical protein